jgi:hypothetical protein
MESKTFKKEIKFSIKNFNVEKNEWEDIIVTKTATFKELSQTDSTQHQLIFLVSPLFVEQRQIGGETKMIADPVVLLDLTKASINCLLIEDTEFNIQDKIEFLNDGFALFRFGQWFLQNKFSGFFFNTINSY